MATVISIKESLILFLVLWNVMIVETIWSLKCFFIIIKQINRNILKREYIKFVYVMCLCMFISFLSSIVTNKIVLCYLLIFERN